MAERMITLPHYFEIKDWTPLVFLAGPVQGAADYQTRFAEYLLKKRDDIAVASPRPRLDDIGSFSDDEKMEWELRHRFRARGLGVTAIWFAARDFSIAFPNDRPYEQTTMIELGETVGWSDIQKPREKVPYAKLVVGFDPRYAANGGGNEDYVRRSLKLRGLPIFSDEQAFLDAVVDSV